MSQLHWRLGASENLPPWACRLVNIYMLRMFRQSSAYSTCHDKKKLKGDHCQQRSNDAETRVQEVKALHQSIAKQVFDVHEGFVMQRRNCRTLTNLLSPNLLVCCSGRIRPQQGTEICNFGASSPLEFFGFFSSAFSSFSRFSVYLSEKSLQKCGEIPDLRAGEKGAESCHVSGCHGLVWSRVVRFRN